MRDILFCGKRTDYDEWVTGYFYHVKHWVDENKIVLGKNSGTLFEASVNPDTIRQYTGLPDKADKAYLRPTYSKVMTDISVLSHSAHISRTVQSITAFISSGTMKHSAKIYFFGLIKAVLSEMSTITPNCWR